MGPVPQRLSDSAVAALQQRFIATLDRRLAEALVAPLDPARQEALRGLLLAASRSGEELEDAQLRRLARRPVAAILARTARMPGPLPRRELTKIERAVRERTEDDRYDPLFGTRERLYFPLVADESGVVEQRVAAALAPLGYRITDYAAGRATDAAGKQSFRIGKLLQPLDAGLYRAFQDDGARTGAGLLLCLSRLPLDIARMSTGRGWHSCMAYGDVFFDQVFEDIRRGTLVAYLVSERDPEAAQPLARMLLKPFENGDGRRMLQPAKPYGLTNSRFEATVHALADAANAALPQGLYRLRHDLYKDDLSERSLLLHAPLTAERLLNLLGCTWERRRDGRIHVDGDLDISDRNLRTLPDLRQVVVHGDFSCSRNKLTSVAWMPQEVDGDILIARNRLTSLEGVPALVQGSFDCGGNLLTSLEHGPRRVFGRFNCDDNLLSDLRHGPQEVGLAYNCAGNRLVSLVGAPREITGDFLCHRNRLTTLAGAPRSVTWRFDCSNNRLSDLIGAPQKIGNRLFCNGNPLESMAGMPRGRYTLATPFGEYQRPAEVPAAMRGQDAAGRRLARRRDAVLAR